MLVLKFGGTSLGSAERIKKVAKLLNSAEPKIAVLSAMSGTTNSLVEIANYISHHENNLAADLIEGLRVKYHKVIAELYSKEETKKHGLKLVGNHFDYLLSFTQDSFTINTEKTILAQGELLSTTMFQLYLEEIRQKSKLLSALDFMRIDSERKPDSSYIQENLECLLQENADHNLFITEGFICRNEYGEIDNLKRGGSDYTASLIGVAVKASEIQIWTDIDGMHNNDPRIVENTRPIHNLSFEEAAELAYFGAKILHPSSILPAKGANIPVRLKSILSPESIGTLISSETEGTGIKAIAAKDNICAIKIRSGRMLLAHGFMRKVFEIFELYKTPIDMIATSEVAVSLTIDDTSQLENICRDLKEYGSVEVDENQTIICIVGDYIRSDKGVAAKIFKAVEDVTIRMISYGGGNHNISLLVDGSDKRNALIQLNKLINR